MKKINVQTPDGTILMQGQCISSEFQWSKNIEDRTHLCNGVYSTKQVSTDYFKEIWEVEGQKIRLSKFETDKIIKYMINE